MEKLRKTLFENLKKIAFPWLLLRIETAPIFLLHVSPIESSASANETELNISHNLISFLPNKKHTT